MARVLTLFLLAAALPTFAQDYTERVEVEVIEVPVNVLDSQSQPVSGLEREDFILRVNGKEHEIEYFDVIDQRAPQTMQSEIATASEDPPIERRILILVDTVFSGYRALYRAVEAAGDYLDDAHPSDLIAIAAYRSGRVEYLTPFTRDRALAYSAVRTLQSPGTADPLRLTIAPELRLALAPQFGSNTAGDDVGRISEEEDGVTLQRPDDWLGSNPQNYDDIGSFGPTGNVLQAGTQRIMAEMADQGSRRHIREQIETLEGVAEDLSILSGQKQILLVSQGFSSGLILRDNRLSGILRRMQTKYRQHGIIIHTINTETVGLGKGMTTDRSQALFNIAHETGGVAFSNSNMLGKHFDRFQRSQQITYLLSFRMPADTRPGYNDIDVEVSDDRARRVIARPGFFGVTERSEPSETARSLQLAETVLGNRSSSDIRVSVSAANTREGVTVTIVTHTADLLAVGSDRSEIEGEMLIYILNGESVYLSKPKEVSFEIPRIRKALIAEGKTFETASIGWKENFELPAGSWTVRVVFRFEGSDLIGVGSTDVSVP